MKQDFCLLEFGSGFSRMRIMIVGMWSICLSGLSHASEFFFTAISLYQKLCITL